MRAGRVDKASARLSSIVHSACQSRYGCLYSGRRSQSGRNNSAILPLIPTKISTDMRKDSLTTRLLLISIAVVATYAAITQFGFG